MTVHSPRLRNSSGAELNLRSQILFQDQTRTRTSDLVTTVGSWHKTYVHESSHWAQYHGSTVGILLSLLRRTRGQLAAYTISHLPRQDVEHLHENRSSGLRFFSFERYPKHAQGELKYSELDWLNLYFAYYLLLDPEGLTEFDTATWDMRAAMEHSLEEMWRQGAGMEMVECPDDVRVGIDGPLELVHTSEGPLTTRVLFECAAVLDELFQFEGAFIRKADPALREFLLEVLNGEYGMPCRLARALAGRTLGGSTVLALIDFALNPVVPGLNSDDPSVDWKELYPPYRFVTAAKAMAGWETDLEFQYPSDGKLGFPSVRPLDPPGSRHGPHAPVRAYACRVPHVRFTSACPAGKRRLFNLALRRQFPGRESDQVHQARPGHAVAVPGVPGESG
ncbi:hypothetical protein ABZ016_36595 [Streptomyces sp. NPDC006372]|uniref:hypothetical protein n=1 Tax=Streptomyces sp. NPDC006372 TaxID=3155599 RepID=UPI0033A446A9